MDDALAQTDLGAGPGAARLARRAVREALRGVAPEAAVDTVVLLASELVTNAALHVGGRVYLRLRTRPGVVRIEVHDAGTRLPAPRRALGHDRTSGRGLHMVEQLSERWGSEPEDGGKQVWCEVAVA